MKKTNAILLALVLALFAYVTIRERFGLTTGDTRDRSAHVLPELVRDRLESIRVEARGDAPGTFVLHRGPRDPNGDPTFRFTAPTSADADAERVIAAISAIEWADPLRTLSGADDASRRRYGLDQPRLRVVFEVAGESVRLSFGSSEATTGGVYALAGDRVVVVGHEVFEAFAHDAAFFRVRRFARDLPDDPTSIEVKSEHADVLLRRADATWRAERPVAALASEGRVNLVLSFLRTIEATRFVDEHPTDLARYGLDTPTLRIDVGDASHPDATSLTVGRACADDATARYARAGSGPVVCVAASELEPLQVEPNAYLELRASATEAGGVQGVELHAGERTLTVTLQEGVSRFRLGQDTGDADPESVERWLEALRTVRATEVVTDAAAFAPTVTLTVHRTGTRSDDVVRFARAADGRWLGRRGQDGVLLRFPAVLGELLALTTLHVRDLGLVHEDPSALSEIRIERPGGTEVLRHADAPGLAIVEPVAVAADTARSADLAMRLAGLEAVRFVGDAPTPEHGLTRPRIVVTFTFREASGTNVVHRLRIGASASDGTSYGQLDDSPVVFAVVAATVELLETPLASREELHTESLFVDRLSVRSGARTVHLVRDGGHYRLDEAAFDDARANAAVNAIADLRAVAIEGYGAPAPALGLSPAASEIRIVRAAEAPEPREIVLSVGSIVGEGDARFQVVRRSDRPVTYRVPAGALEPVLALSR